MKAKAYSYLLLLALLLVAFWFINRNTGGEINSGHRSEKAQGTVRYRNDGFQRKVHFLEYTVHARCRMECRHITQDEVQDILKHGTINYRKSDLSDRPCPTYALEGFTQEDNQHVRVVFAQCGQKTRVVTCIDLDTDFRCNCK